VSIKIDQLAEKNMELEERLAATEHTRELSHSELWRLRDEVQSIKETMDFTRYSQFASSGTLASKTGRPFGSRRRKGFCQVIVNKQEREALDEEKVEFESVFKNLGFYVDEKVCELYDDVEPLINSVASRDYDDYNLFVCFVQSSVTKDWKIERFGGRSLSVTELLAKFRSLGFPQLQKEMPKIFIIQGHQTTTALEADEPLEEKSLFEKSLSEISLFVPSFETSSFEKSFSVKLSAFGKNFLCLFVPYRRGYISTLLSVIKLHSLERRDILDVFSEAKKLFYEKSRITIPEPIHNLTGPVYLNWEI